MQIVYESVFAEFSLLLTLHVNHYTVVFYLGSLDASAATLFLVRIKLIKQRVCPVVVSSDGRTFLLPLIQLLFLEVVYSWVFCSFLGICLPFVYCFSIASVDVSRVSVSFF